MKTEFFPRAGFLQFEIRFGESLINLETVRRLVDSMSPQPGTILVLPELWASGFDYARAADHARHTPEILARLTEMAGRRGIFFAGSLLEEDGENPGCPYNSLYICGPEGIAGRLQKQHLFALWQEDRHFQPGGYCPSVETPRGRLGGLVCYDLRFPEILGGHARQGATLMVVAAQWPAVRVDHWRTLLRARAIENQVYIVACNACGETNGTAMAGHSLIAAPDGNILAEAGESEEALAIPLAEETIRSVRDRFCTAGENPRPIRDAGKIVSPARLATLLAPLRGQGSRIGFTNGCFDILHSGHVSYLEKARAEADCLVVGLNSDSSVRAIKGSGRPVNSEAERARVLAGLGCVDFVVSFAEETPLELIRMLRPDVLIKGADWPEEEIVGAAEVKQAGGMVVRIDFEHDLSTTDLISRIRQSRSGT